MKRQFFTLLFISSIFFQSNLTAQWESLGSGITNNAINLFSIAVVDENIVWGVGFPLSGAPTNIPDYTYTTDGGLSWNPGVIPPLGGVYQPLNIQAIDDQTAWILMVDVPSQQSVKVVKTTDGGATWTEQTGGFNDSGHAIGTMHFFNENDGVLYGSPGTGNASIDTLQMYTTGDGGSTWTRVNPSTLPTPLPGEGCWIASGNGSVEAIGDTMWGLTRAQRVFKTVDKGLSWEAYDVSVAGASSLNSIAFQDPMNGIVVGSYPNFIGRTTDGGLNWTDISPLQIPITANAIEYVPGTSNSYVLMDAYLNNPGLFITRDGGDTWTTEIYYPTVTCLTFLSETVGFAGGQIISATEGGMYKWTGNLVSIESFTNNSDVGIILYPNPTSSQITIETPNTTLKNSFLTLYNISDQQLIKRQITEPLTTIDIRLLPNGIYVVKVWNDKNVMVEKVIKQ